MGRNIFNQQKCSRCSRIFHGSELQTPEAELYDHMIKEHPLALRNEATVLPENPRGIVRPHKEGYSEDTLFKVYRTLRAVGNSEEEAAAAINALQNAGILFRERIEEPLVLRKKFEENKNVCPVEGCTYIYINEAGLHSHLTRWHGTEWATSAED